MKATYRSFAKSGTLQKNRELYTNKDCFLHPLLLLFEENFYLMDGKRRSHRTDVKSVFGTWSAVAVKRLIGSMRDHNYLKIADSGFVQNQTDELDADLYFYPLMKMICLILGISLFPRIRGETSSRSKMSQSIHSIFLFLEDRFPKSNYVLEVDLPPNLHLETSIRLFRRQIRDVSFLHLLRMVFYIAKISRGKTIHSRRRVQKGSVDTPVRNFYIFQIDSVFLIPWKQVCKMQVNYFLPIDSCNMIRKERHISPYEFELDEIGVDSYLIRSSCVHYGRWRNKFIIASGGTRYFVKKWLHYLRTLLKYHFHYRTEFNEPRFKLLSTSCVSFLGYTLVARPVSKNVRIETATGLYISLSGGKNFHPKIPNSVITKTLAKQKFCDINGRPAGKLAWVASTDDEILDEYVQLWQVLSSYYGASMNRQKLRRLRYILQISCDSTLAGKHGGTIRLLQRRLNLEIPNQFLAFSKSEPSNSRRVWRSTSIRSVLVEFAILEMGL
uniref:Maturase K n=1 Tax=Adiantum shastense TaxID=2052490 RepID=A0A2P1MBG3_9MONI|nr:maturase K [Adiantum shastense]AVP32717.1 maturase K [Adiantum shastense]